VLAAAAGTATTVIISSHVIGELERFCDWLIVLARGHIQLAGPADGLLAAHRLLTIPRATPDAELPGRIIHRSDSDRHSTVLIRTGPIRLAAEAHAGWHTEPVGFEQLVLAYLRRSSGAARTANPATSTVVAR
jgi:ABC-2 type transport system ATP-binding protein